MEFNNPNPAFFNILREVIPKSYGNTPGLGSFELALVKLPKISGIILWTTYLSDMDLLHKYFDLVQSV